VAADIVFRAVTITVVSIHASVGSAFGSTLHAWVPAVTTSDHRPVASVVTLPK
jgi:hypothetical protein